MEDITDDEDEVPRKNRDPDEIRKISNDSNTHLASSSNNPNTNETKNKHIHNDPYYCQPTSSKVLVEDLITSEEDEQHFKEYHVAMDEEDDVDAHQPITGKQ